VVWVAVGLDSSAANQSTCRFNCLMRFSTAQAAANTTTRHMISQAPPGRPANHECHTQGREPPKPRCTFELVTDYAIACSRIRSQSHETDQGRPSVLFYEGSGCRDGAMACTDCPDAIKLSIKLTVVHRWATCTYAPKP
jgi:hypothetical protein